jgi:serine/threonine protein kinase
LPRIYDHFEEQQRWYLVLDYIDGQTLEQTLANSPQGKLSVETVIEYALQLCSVLEYLHTQTPPIIFRDLKPANIMTTPAHHLYLIDFGIARFFKPGQAKDTVALGSVGYAPPEQFGRSQTTPQADIYGLGATLHHLLSGRDPSDESFVFPPLDLEPQNAMTRTFAALLARMVAIKQEERPGSVQEIQQALSTFQRISQLSQSPISTPAGQQSSNVFPVSKPAKPQSLVPAQTLATSSFPTRLLRFTRRGRRKWTFEANIGNEQIPLIINNIVYVISYPPYRLNALHADSGRPIWSFPIGDWTNLALVGNSNVVCVGNHDVLYGRHALSGLPLWSFSRPRGFFDPSLLMEGDVIYVKVSDTIFALNATSGQELWSFRFKYFFEKVPLSHVIIDGVVYFGAGNLIHALDATSGQELCSFQTQGEITNTTVVDSVIYGTTKNKYGTTKNKVYAIDAFSGQGKGWPIAVDEPTWLRVANNIIYLGSNHNLYALDALSGQQLWVFPAGNASRTPSTVADGIVYVGSNDHNLYALDATSGRPLWAFQTRGVVDGESTVRNGVVYFGSKDTKLHALNATSGQYLWSFSGWRSQNRYGYGREWSAPLVQNGTVYVYVRGKLHAIFA